MGIYNINLGKHSDKQILVMIGDFIKYHRQNQNKTQSDLADEAGINRSTLSEIENGNRSNTMTLIRLLRSLGQLHVLSALNEINRVSPIALAEEQHPTYRKRVRKKAPKKSTLPKSDW